MKIDGIEVEDAKKPVVLHITKRDATSGQKDPKSCAAAKAACRLEGVLEARVYRGRTYLLFRLANGKKIWRRYHTPISLRTEITAFDRGGAFEPDDFELKPLTASQLLGAKPPGAQSGPRATKRKPHHVIKGIREHGPRSGDKN